MDIAVVFIARNTIKNIANYFTKLLVFELPIHI